MEFLPGDHDSEEINKSEKESSSKEEVFQNRLQRILETKITVENIDGYFVNVLNDLIYLTDDLVADFKSEHTDNQLEGRELEDAAFQANHVTPIDRFLEVANYKTEYLKRAERVAKVHINKVITPPDILKPIDRNGGTESYVPPRLTKRLIGLLYIIQENGISLDDIEVREGVVTEDMMRANPYFSVVIPRLDRLALVCDEEGNASYIFDLTKLAEKEITVEEIEEKTKSERNKLIVNDASLGVRYIYTKDWIDKTEAFLTEPLESSIMVEKNASPGIPHVSRIELDPWRGFWTDPDTGEHWASSVGIATELQWTIQHHVIKRIAPRQKSLYTVNGTLGTGYCLEDFVSLLNKKELAPEREGLPPTEEDGEWQDFSVTVDGHWGTLSALSKKLQTSERYLQHLLAGKKGKWIFNSKVKKQYMGYRIEDLQTEKLPPELQKSGDWKNFHIDQEGNHWGNVSTLSTKIKLDDRTLNKLISDVHSMDIWATGSQGWRPAYCYEDIMELPYVKNLKSLPMAEREGATKGFIIDTETADAWGTVVSLERMLPLRQEAINTLIKRHPELRTKQGVAPGVNQERTFYNYQEIASILRAENPDLNIPNKVGEQDPWKDFETDDLGHWGTAKHIAIKLGKGYNQVKRLLEDKPFRIVPPATGKKGKGRQLYRYEDALDTQA